MQVESMDVVFTGRELDVMAVLWERGSGTVAEVRERLKDVLAYTTVLSVLQTLEQKGHVRHTAEGKAYRYQPLVARDLAARTEMRRTVQRYFGGSPDLAFSELIADPDISRDALRRMQEALERRCRLADREAG